MPPKGKKKPASAPKEVEPPAPIESALPTEREIQLKGQLESITSELKNMRLKVEELKK